MKPFMLLTLVRVIAYARSHPMETSRHWPAEAKDLPTALDQGHLSTRRLHSRSDPAAISLSLTPQTIASGKSAQTVMCPPLPATEQRVTSMDQQLKRVSTVQSVWL